MKKSLIIAAATAVVFLAGCGHQFGLVGIGTGFRAGGQGYGVSYGDGLFGTFVTKDGVNFRAELDATQGFSYEPSSNTYKGIKSVEYSVAPQINGYAVEFSQKNPDVAKMYYEALVKYYEIKENNPQAQKPLVSDEKSKEATTSVAEVIKKAISKAKSIVDGESKDKGDEATFQCNGNCNYDDLTGNADIAYQLSIALKLLSYDGYTNKFEDTGEYYTQTLEHFITQLIQYQAKGNATTPLRVKYVTVKDGVITRLMFAYVRDNGEIEDVECPSCIAM